MGMGLVVRRPRWVYVATLLAIATMTGCAGPVAPGGPYVVVLGTAQDGGIPHAACWCGNCRAARNIPSRRRFVSSLALVLPNGPHPGPPLIKGRVDAAGIEQIYLFDATPDVRGQVDLIQRLRGARGETHNTLRQQPVGSAILSDGRRNEGGAGASTTSQPSGVDRRPVDGIFLTHAHIGHYLGLAFLGYEAIHTSGLPVYCTPRMAGFLRDNGPWSQLVRIGNITLNEFEDTGRMPVPQPLATTVRLPQDAPSGCGVLVTPIQVPHRDEFSDTVGFLIRAESKAADTANGPAVLFIPDTEPWERLKPPLVELIDTHGVTTAILDGTFYSAGELPERGAAKIGHPLMTDTMTLLEPLVKHGRLVVYFTHLNHSNPALDPGSAASRQIRARGFQVAREGMRIPLVHAPESTPPRPSRY